MPLSGSQALYGADQVKAAQWAVDRAVILKAGRMVFDGPARELEDKKSYGNGFDRALASIEWVVRGQGLAEACLWADLGGFARIPSTSVWRRERL
jgi:hypothetical protein